MMDEVLFEKDAPWAVTMLNQDLFDLVEADAFTSPAAVEYSSPIYLRRSRSWNPKIASHHEQPWVRVAKVIAHESVHEALQLIREHWANYALDRLHSRISWFYDNSGISVDILR